MSLPIEEWGLGLQVGAAMGIVCLLLPLIWGMFKLPRVWRAWKLYHYGGHVWRLAWILSSEKSLQQGGWTVHKGSSVEIDRRPPLNEGFAQSAPDYLKNGDHYDRLLEEYLARSRSGHKIQRSNPDREEGGT